MTPLSHIPIAPADAAPHNELDAEDLYLLQRKALREWQHSDWLAEHDPRTFEALREQPADVIRVDLGGGIGDSQQIPGCVVIGGYATPQDLAGTVERRLPDFQWLEPNALPFGTATIDELHALRVPASLRPVLNREIARVMKLGGRVETWGNPGPRFEREGTTQWWVCTQRHDPMSDVGPMLVDEKVFGQPIRRERA